MNNVLSVNLALWSAIAQLAYFLTRNLDYASRAIAHHNAMFTENVFIFMCVPCDNPIFDLVTLTFDQYF
jgi:hypothetical protein